MQFAPFSVFDVEERYIVSPETMAAKVLAAHQRICSPPVDVFSMVRARGILVYERPLIDPQLSGVFRWVRNVPTILLNQRHIWTRRRFTLAHELYHYLNDMPTPEVAYLMLRRGRMTADERAANRFAAALLMPTDLVYALRRQGLGVDDMCRILAVSKAAMLRRCAELHLEG
jgi:Zn-dependent peptidase ImmA (M78 family)